MPLLLKDRVKQVTTTKGTGPLTLASTPAGFRSFGSCLSNGDTTYYCIESGSQWEVGVGTYSSNTLARTTVLASSNANALVNITASRSFVFISYIADKATYKDGSGRIVADSAGIVFSDASIQTTAATTPDLSPYLTTSSASSTYLTQSSATTLLAAKADLVGGLVPSAQLPSYVDDVVEAANLAAFPGTGETGKIYVAIDTGYTYRWSGSIYVRINEVDLSSYLTSSTASATYLPLAGGTLTGQLTMPYGDSTNPSILIGNTNTGIHGLNGASRRIRFTVAGQVTAEYASGAHIIQGSLIFGTLGSSPDAGILSPATDVVEVRYINRNTTAQTFQLNNTWTSSTSFENLRIKANAGAAYQIGSAIGSAGGSARAITFGHWNAGGTFSGTASITTDGRFSDNGGTPGDTSAIFGAGTSVFLSSGSKDRQTVFGGAAQSLGPWSVVVGGQAITELGGVAIGASAYATNQSVAIGMAAGANGTSGGVPSSYGVNGYIILRANSGSAAPTAQYQFIVSDVRDGYFGNGITNSSPQGFKLNATGGSGTNIAGANFTLAGGRGTGSAAGGSLIFQTAPAGSSGSSANALVDRLTIGSTGTFTFGGGLTIGPFTGYGASTDYIQASSSWSVEPHLLGYPWHFGFDTSTPRVTIQTANSTTGVRVGSDGAFMFSSTTNSRTGTIDLFLMRDGAGVLSQRNSTNAQSFCIYNTYTSTTSFENLQFKANAGAAYQIGSAIGSAGGSNRAIQIGHWNAAGSFTSSFSVNTTANQVQIGTIIAGYNTSFSTGVYGVNLNNATPHCTIWSGDSSAFGSSFSGYNVFMVGHDVGVLSGYGIGSYPKFVYSNSSSLSIPQICIGNASGFSGLDLSFGTTGTPSDGEYTVTSGYGANKFGASMWLMGGRSTGNGAGGSVYIGSSTTGSSGSTRNSNFTIAQFSPFFVSFNQSIASSGSPAAFTVTGAAHTTLTASTEATDVNFNLARTVQFATGAISTQRAMRIQAPTYSFVGASTITTASTLSISGPPAAGTNATITNAYALNVESGKSRFGDEINLINGSNQTLRIAMDTNNPIISSAFTRMIVSGTAVWLRTDGGVFFMRSDDSEIGRVSISGFSLTMQSNTNGPLTLTVPTSGNSNQGANAVNVIGQTALSSSTNVLGGGAVNITGGNGASASAGNAYGGDIVLTPGTGYGTGRQGVVSVLGPITNTSTGITELRNLTNAQTLRVAGTWTSTTAYETFNIKGKASANFEIGPENGSAGGTLRGLTIGGYSAGSSTITPWMSFTGSTGELGIFGNGVVRQSKYGDDATAAIYTLRKYRGTEASPTALNSGDTIAQILFQGYHGATIGNVAAIQVVATEAFTSSPVNRPTRMYLNTTGPLDTQSSVRMTIDDSGDVGIGTTTISARAHVVSTTEQLRIGYNLSNYYSTTVSSAGAVTFNAVGSAPSFTFSDAVMVPTASPGTNTTQAASTAFVTAAVAAGGGGGGGGITAAKVLSYSIIMGN